MGTIKSHAGDFGKKDIGFTFGSFSYWEGFKIVTIPASELESVEVATEEKVKKVAGTVGWGVAGAVLLGPVGLLAGLLAGGNKKEITFIAVFKDGRKMLATTDSKTFTKLQAAAF